MKTITLHLRSGREKLARSGHPWIFDGALDKNESQPKQPCLVELHDAKNQFVGKGTFNPLSRLAIRLFTGAANDIDEDFFASKFQNASELRKSFIDLEQTDSYRLVHGEGDGLPGLIVDNFAGHLVIQVGTPGLNALKDAWFPALQKIFEPKSIIARPDQGAANRERFEPMQGELIGSPPETLLIRENAVQYEVRLGSGQKTGFFFDQRENRRRIAALASGKRVLDAFCYHGGFALASLARGADFAVAVDSSPKAIEATTRNAALNKVDARMETEQSDCHKFLRAGEKDFDVVVIDPPALAKQKKHTDKAARAYKDLFLFGLKRVKPKGFALLCSCSGSVDRRLFDQIVAGAVLDSKRTARIIQRAGAGQDHPVNVAHPEGEYLKSTLLSVD
jgi:23S rRNA (cytosine1962-C5)-methyltransferase